MPDPTRQWKGQCEFCGQTLSGWYMPPDAAQMSYDLPLSYGGGTLCRCAKCGSLYCHSCAMKNNECCPKCGDNKWEHAAYRIAGYR